MVRSILETGSHPAYVKPLGSSQPVNTKTILSALWAVLLIISGWVYVDARESRQEMRADISGVQIQMSDTRSRVAVLEEALRNQKESLTRIEQGVNNLQRKTPGF